ncbi:MAG: hypothetical protein ACYTDU_19600 [Planctomycetota bacterium]
MSWLEIYVPLSRLDAGLKILLLVWVLTVVAGFAAWLTSRRRQP